MIILLEGIKTKCSETCTEMLSLSMKKQTSSKICYLTFCCSNFSNTIHIYGFNRRISPPPTSKGKRYALTIICMLTGYVFCIPIKTKTAEEVLQAYIDNVYSKFGGSLKILSDNGTEFKNKIFEQVAKELGVVYKIYTPPYHPASNGRIEGFHAFLKACISKHISPQLEWDDLVPLACAAYNFMPNKHSKESPFFLMFGRDPVLPLNTLLEPKI